MRHRTVALTKQALSLLLAGLLLAPSLHAERTRLKPGMNFYSEQKDIEFGRQAAQEAERQLPLLKVRAVDAYLNRLGKRLARRAPGYKFPYQFKTINQGEINAFALPGGFLYVNRGTIEAAENEAQLAGVMAHEIAHVALRHGTNQLSKAQLASAPLAILGGVLGGGGTAEQLAQLGIQVGFSSVFLKFSRTAESQADLLGTQILFDARYDPRAMAEFFETLQKRSKKRGIEFFSSHPNPENRQGKIEKEIEKLGPLKNPRRDSEDFHVIQQRLRDLPPPPKPGTRRRAKSGRIGRPSEPPSRRMVIHRQADFTIAYPANWKKQQAGTQVLLAPPGGVGEEGIAYGVLVNVRDLDDPRMSLREATDQLVRQILRSQPRMREISRERARVAGRRAITTHLRGRSPLPGEQETDWLFTVRLRDSLFYAIFIVPESDSRIYQPAFQEMLDSVRFR